MLAIVEQLTNGVLALPVDGFEFCDLYTHEGVLDKKNKAKELIERLEPAIREVMVETVPGFGLVLQTYEQLSAAEKREVQRRTTLQIADLLVASIPFAAAIVPAAVLLARVILENPEAVEALSSPQVRELATVFSERIHAAEGRLDEEKAAINSAINEALSLPSSIKAAAIIVMLGACGSASWDAVKYTYSEGQRILQEAEISENQSVDNIDAIKGKEIALYTSTADGLRLRSEPSYDATINALIYAEERIVVFKVSGDWAFVSLLDRQDSVNIGWVHTDYIEPRS